MAFIKPIPARLNPLREAPARELPPRIPVEGSGPAKVEASNAPLLGSPPVVGNPTAAVRDVRAQGLAALINERRGTPGLLETWSGALRYLDETQIRDRPGLATTRTATLGPGVVSVAEWHLPVVGTVEVPVLGRMRNARGEWDSQMHGLPGLGGPTGQSLVSAPDSNPFFGPIVMHGLSLVRDHELSPDAQFVGKMRNLARDSFNQYKRPAGYVFWPEQANGKVGPNNLPTWMAGALRPLLTNPFLASAVAMLGRDIQLPPRSWLEAIADSKTNRGGMAEFFNVPPDVDCTSCILAAELINWLEHSADPRDHPPQRFFEALRIARRVVDHLGDKAFNHQGDMTAEAELEISRQLEAIGIPATSDYFAPLRAQLGPAGKVSDVRIDPDAGALLESFNGYLDTGRKTRDARDPPETGAVLTWMKDENESPFAYPETGVMPLAINNVDSVVNANVVFALALYHKKDNAAYRGAVEIVKGTVAKRTWIEDARYYPQGMIFPYVISRAYRDGGATDLRSAMQTLLVDLLAAQDQHAKAHPDQIGAFGGGKDPSTHASTALAVCALLNIGRDVAESLSPDVVERYGRAIDDGINYLLAGQKTRNARDPGAHGDESKGKVSSWEPGLFFSDGFGDHTSSDLVHWRSSAFTAGLAFEAMSKYLLAYDAGGVSLADPGSRRLVLKKSAPGDLAVEVSSR